MKLAKYMLALAGLLAFAGGASAADKTVNLKVKIQDGAPFTIKILSGNDKTLSRSMTYRLEVVFYPVPLPQSYKKVKPDDPGTSIALDPTNTKPAYGLVVSNKQVDDTMLTTLGFPSTADPSKGSIAESFHIAVTTPTKENCTVFADVNANRYMVRDALPGRSGLKALVDLLSKFPLNAQIIDFTSASAGKPVEFNLNNFTRCGQFEIKTFLMQSLILNNKAPEAYFPQLTIKHTIDITIDPSVGITHTLFSTAVPTEARNSDGAPLDTGAAGQPVSMQALAATLAGAGLDPAAIGGLNGPGFEFVGGTNLADTGIKPIGGVAGYLRDKDSIGLMGALTNDGGTAFALGVVGKVGSILRPYVGATFSNRAGSTHNGTSFGILLNITSIFSHAPKTDTPTVHVDVDPGSGPAGVKSFADSERRPAGAVFFVDGTALKDPKITPPATKNVWANFYDGSHLLGRFRLFENPYTVQFKQIWTMYAVGGTARVNRMKITGLTGSDIDWDRLRDDSNTKYYVDLFDGTSTGDYSFKNGDFHHLKISYDNNKMIKNSPILVSAPGASPVVTAAAPLAPAVATVVAAATPTTPTPAAGPASTPPAANLAVVVATPLAAAPAAVASPALVVAAGPVATQPAAAAPTTVPEATPSAAAPATPVPPAAAPTVTATPIALIVPPAALIAKAEVERLPVRIHAGGTKYTAAGDGRQFEADAYATGGETKALKKVGIANTDDPTLYRTFRYGYNFGYTLTVPNGSYKLKLHFAETGAAGPKARLINISVNGLDVINNLDVFTEAKGAFTALIKTVPVTVSNGAVVIAFKSSDPKGSAFVNAIELIPVASK
jgi:hypothetical protein